jgi:preprotein translocase subunit SecE
MRIVSSIVNYLRSSRAELQKVTWPSRKDTIRYSALVLSVSVIVAVFFAALDYGLGTLVTVAFSSRQAAQTEQQPAETPTTVPTPTPAPTFDLTNENQALPTGGDTAPSTNP